MLFLIAALRYFRFVFISLLSQIIKTMRFDSNNIFLLFLFAFFDCFKDVKHDQCEIKNPRKTIILRGLFLNELL